ncbi:acylase [Formosa sediminum]|uniref:Acylase n=1 Tax=Formosa sediminum TaxID=2594004 RepID=A0A516GU99_9FLAO|nr:acylase [Formosa sediminum]QDO95088.1 acylase [Formosa sediminum]
MYRHLFIVFLITLIGCKKVEKTLTAEEMRWQHHTKNIEIIRDDYGVPHIYGQTDADAVFGLLYAQCEDDFNRVERNYIWAIGRLAEVEGEQALYSDLRANLYMTKDEAIANYNNSPIWLQKLCIAFADGINYYLKTHPDVQPKLLTHFEPWMPMYFSEGSIGGDIERISTKKIKSFYAPDSDDKLAVNEGLIRLKDDEPRGSNGFAISGSKTKSGNAMLLINPHTSFFFRGEVHVVSEEGLNAYGAVTWGQFFVYQGFNEKTGWMHTSTGTDIIDEFEETIVKDGTKTSYQYGENLRSVDSLKVTLNYKLADGNTTDKTFTIYRTHHGPITHANADKWVATALMWSPIKALEQSFTRTKKSNHEGFYNMMKMRTNSSNNTVYADADGTIAYYHGNFIPKRNEKFDYTKAVDGSNPETDWKGIHDLEDNIFVLNPPNGWIQNCNSTPFTSAAEYSPKPEAYPKYMTSFPENFRGIHAIPLLTEAKELTLDGLINLTYDSYLPGAELLINGLLEAAKQAAPENQDTKDALELLTQWDFRVSTESVQMTLAQFYLNAYLASDIIKQNRLKRMDAFNYMSNEAPVSERIKIFELALEELKLDFGTWKTPWGEFNRYQRNDGAIVQKFDDKKPSIPVGMASGTWGALASFGTKFGADTKRQYGTSGNSFVAVVEFGTKVKAKSLLAGGQSSNPKSSHFSDQSQRYADAKFKDVAFYRSDVEKRAETIYHPGDQH